MYGALTMKYEPAFYSLDYQKVKEFQKKTIR